MKALLLCTLLSSFSISALAQQLPKVSYVVIRLQLAKDQFHKKSFFKIVAEEGNPDAAVIYNLKDYDAEKGPEAAIALYSAGHDTADYYYNYFRNATEALLFLSSKGWQLASILNEIISGEQLTGSTINGNAMVPITTVTSRPVYFFKKEL